MAGAAAAIIPAAASLIGGLFNRRPPTLDPVQRSSLDALIKNLMPTATGTPQIDPIQQALMYANIARGQTGAADAATHLLTSRGLGRSGLLGEALTQVANQAQAGRNQADLGLQQQAIQQKQLTISDLLGLLNVGNIPGQSALGGATAGLAPILAYSIANMMNNRGNDSNQVPGLPPGINPGDIFASSGGNPYGGRP